MPSRHHAVARRTLLQGTAGLVAASAVPWAAGCDAAAPTPPPPPEQSAAVRTPLGLTFPPGFTWGAATSAYQIEGAAREDGRGQSIWDTFSHTPGRTRDGDTGDVAADHYHRYVEDVALMGQLGLGSYRFSLSWPRILPEGTGRVNQKGLDFYKRLLDELHRQGIAPMVTLFHWDLPQALQDRGGWAQRDCSQWFAEYAAVVFKELGDAVPTWLTINEPKTIVMVGYQFGAHAPGVSDVATSQVVAHHLLLAHGLAVRALRASGAKGRIGPALNLAPVYPADESELAKRAVPVADGLENRVYLDPVLKGSYPPDLLALLPANAPVRNAIRDGDLAIISTRNDLLAVQYYNPLYVNGAGSYVTKLPTSVATWQQIYPRGLYDILIRVKRDYGDIPLSVTENGVPVRDEVDSDGAVRDHPRIEFLRDHLAAAHRAIGEGVKLESYHVWSLLDNFEWAEGYSQRWGIVYVDYATQRRIPKSSASWYRDVIARNQI
jgi:beta-glucosidase